MLSRSFIREWEAAYYPCRNGLHVFDPDDDRFGGVTVRNFPMLAGDARRLFEECRVECESHGDDPEDYLVDLCVDGDCMTDNFFISRQMLERLVNIISRHDGD